MKRVLLSALLFLVCSTALPIGLSAARPDAPEYAVHGPYTVGTRDFTIQDADRPINLTIWYPAQNPDNLDETVTYQIGLLKAEGHALRDALSDDSNAPYPLVIFSHGNSGIRFQSLYLTEHLASYGFIVIALDHPTNTLLDSLNQDIFNKNLPLNYAYRPDDVIRVIDFAEQLNAADSEFPNNIDLDKIAVAGHSFGGYTALETAGIPINFDQLENWCAANLLNEELSSTICFLLDRKADIANAFGYDEPPTGAWQTITDPRIKAVVAFAPWNGPILDTQGITSLKVPTLIMVGAADTTTPPERDGAFIYDTMFAASPKALVSFQNAGHYVFVDECSELALNTGFFDVCSDEVWDMERIHDIINHITTAFLLANLEGDNEALAALQPDQVSFTGVDYSITSDTIDILEPEVLSVRPHDSEAFTQGLLLYDGFLYESTGQYGSSSLRKVNPETGEVLQQVNLREDIFAEGLALVDNRLIQITWKEQVAIAFDRESFDFIEVYPYTGEGWGLCYDGEYLYMSDGSSNIFQRDPVTFATLGIIPVTMRGEPVVRINELECVGEDIYANIWQTDYIIRLDKETGKVNARIDASNLLPAEERTNLSSGAVLNGIAYDEENDVFLITGKYWQKLFEVRFIEKAESSETQE